VLAATSTKAAIAATMIDLVIRNFIILLLALDRAWTQWSKVRSGVVRTTNRQAQNLNGNGEAHPISGTT